MPFAAHGEAEAVLADRHARMNDDIVADQSVSDNRAWTDEAVSPDGAAIADHGASGDARARTDPRFRADDCARLDSDAVLQPGARVDMGGIHRATRRPRGTGVGVEKRQRLGMGG